MEIDTENLFENKKNDNKIYPETKLQNNPNNENFYYVEEDLVKDHEQDFNYQVRERGLDYYHSNNIISIFKHKNKYIAKVMGSDYEPYKIVLEVKNDKIIYDCTCPCTFPCKHEYAVLIAISNKEYSEVELKEPIREQDINFKAIIEKIPADEIKTYLLSDIGMNNVAFEIESFANYFRKYYPLQKYDYYYNNLYNALVTDDNYDTLTKSYLERVKQYILGNNFAEVFNIIKAIINAYKDSNKLNHDDNFTDILPNMGMFLRVTYRKSNENIQIKISNWITELEAKNFYNNYYLEDIILSVKEVQNIY